MAGSKSLGSSIFGILKIAVLLLALSLTLFVYKRSLLPLYGSIPAQSYLTIIYVIALAIPVLTPRLANSQALLLFGLLLCGAPNTSYWVAVYTARLMNDAAVYGPAVTHAIVLAPIVYAVSSCVMGINISPAQGEGAGATVFDRAIMLQTSYSLTTVLSDYMWPTIAHPGVSDSRIFLTLGGSMIGLYVLIFALHIPESPPSSPLPPPESAPQPSKSKSKLKSKAPPTVLSSQASKPKKEESIFTYRLAIAAVVLSLLPVILPYLHAPTLLQPLDHPYIHPTRPLRILSSVSSKTGLIVVGEALPSTLGAGDSVITSMRYLRASHSLLGGVWIGEKVTTPHDAPAITDAEGTPLGDSIYSAFVLQEAARLVSSTAKGAGQKWDNALLIGLGAGIAATAFTRHNLSTTVVEIDPAVYDAARHFFGLPDPGPDNVFLQDARKWVSERADNVEAHGKLYDIVIHDCFSGGGVPEHLFTLEFWRDLKLILHPDGVVAVNFAGKLASDSSRAILSTLQRSFGKCRGFHDSIQKMTEEQYSTQFINMVFFCTPSSKPLAFRPAHESDYLNSYLREHILSTLPDREVDLSLILGAGLTDEKWILSDQNNMLDAWQRPEAFEHWKVMREVLPDYFWETY